MDLQSLMPEDFKVGDHFWETNYCLKRPQEKVIVLTRSNHSPLLAVRHLLQTPGKKLCAKPLSAPERYFDIPCLGMDISCNCHHFTLSIPGQFSSSEAKLSWMDLERRPTGRKLEMWGLIRSHMLRWLWWLVQLELTFAANYAQYH